MRQCMIYSRSAAAHHSNTARRSTFTVRHKCNWILKCNTKNLFNVGLSTFIVLSYQALEAAEPAPLIPAEFAAQKYQAAWTYKMRRQRARLLAVTVKLKDAARQEQALRLQVCMGSGVIHCRATPQEKP